MLDDLRELVLCESFSGDHAAVRRSAEVVGAVGARLLGAPPETIVIGGVSHLRWRFGELTGAPRVLVLGHHDTVWPVGSLRRLPWSVTDGVARGPGVLDMKAGLVQMFHALASLPSLDGVCVLVNGDEEVGSNTSRELIEEEARQSDAAFVLEAAGDGGALKVARKGAARYEVVVRGRAAHAGVEPGKGVNAAVEAAHLVLAVAGMGGGEGGVDVEAGGEVGAVGAKSEVGTGGIGTEAEVEAVGTRAEAGTEAGTVSAKSGAGTGGIGTEAEVEAAGTRAEAGTEAGTVSAKSGGGTGGIGTEARTGTVGTRAKARAGVIGAEGGTEAEVIDARAGVGAGIVGPEAGAKVGAGRAKSGGGSRGIGMEAQAEVGAVGARCEAGAGVIDAEAEARVEVEIIGTRSGVGAVDAETRAGAGIVDAGAGAGGVDSEAEVEAVGARHEAGVGASAVGTETGAGVISAEGGAGAGAVSARSEAGTEGVRAETEVRAGVISAETGASASVVGAKGGGGGVLAGTTVTPTLLSSGTSRNTVPDLARISVDVRVPDLDEYRRVDALMRGLTARTPGARVEVLGLGGRPPMEASGELFALAALVAAGLGQESPRGVAVGGVSDGNCTAAVGCPTLDGLGAVGGGAHADGEHVEVGWMVPRARLLAGLVAAVLRTPCAEPGAGNSRVPPPRTPSPRTPRTPRER
ncbi:M20/M25/M40 family metallo-hydrolase [Streptomyces acidiscabies]|uniref:M20/M25/M40 family metallo-hydrolase n=1 Tax=Streptomyces acidiscabies TaxID=42234 RepID=UPI0021160B15|nr:M20/M25/M40 family metallo-hydrolase [Streptomyces acidiscabies]